MDDVENGLAELERQQRKVAGQLRLPGWYLVLYGAGVAALMASQPVRMEFHAGVIGTGMQLFGALVLCSPAFVLPRVTGVRLFTNTTATYPSALRTVPWLVGVIALGTLGTLASLLNNLFLPALAVAAAAGIGAAFVLWRVYRGIATDIAWGNVRR